MLTGRANFKTCVQCTDYRLQTPNEGINQINLKFGQTKYALAVTINLGLGFDFRPSSEGDFLTGRP